MDSKSNSSTDKDLKGKYRHLNPKIPDST